MNPINVGLMVALVVTGALFFGSVGETKPLSVLPPTPGLNPVSSPGIAGLVNVSGQSAGLYVSVNLNQPQGEPFVSGVRAGQSSDFISFTVTASDPSGCGGGNSLLPAVRWGTGADSAWASVQLISGNGQYLPFSTNPSGLNQTSYSISFNNSPTVQAYCWTEHNSYPCYGCSSSDVTYNLDGQILESSPTIQLYGAYPSAVLSVAFHFDWKDCGNSYNAQIPACLTPAGSSGPCFPISLGVNCAQFTSGGISTAVGQTIMYSGSANVYPLNGGGLYFNGNTMSFGAVTGYGGQSGWTAEVVDVGRNNGGVDPAFAPIAVGNGVTAQFSWTIPATWSQLSSIPNYNELYVQLVSSFFNLPTTPVRVDVNPSYAPGTPAMTFAVSGGQPLPSLGSTVTISIRAAPPASPIPSGGVVDAVVFAFYLQNGQDVHTLPGSCGNYWISNGCTSGQTIALAPSNGQWVGSFIFNVTTANLPIGILAYTVVSNTQQGANESTLVINQVPSGCNAGQTCYPQPPGPTAFWVGFGPYALMAFLLAGVVALGWWGRHVSPYLIVVAAGIGVVAVVFLFPVAQAWYFQGVL